MSTYIKGLVLVHRYIGGFRKDDILGFNNKTQHSEQHSVRKTLIIMLVLSLIILIPLCSVATYTWLAISKTPKVSDMEMTINSSPGLRLAWSPDAEEAEWQQQLNFLDAVSEDTILTPVTWSDKDSCFYAARFGTDGRMIDAGVRLSDEKDINSRDGHYIKFTVYGKTTQKVNVSLSPAVAVGEGTGSAGTYLIGAPIWQSDEKSHEDGGSGAQFATRIGFKISKVGDTADDNAPMYVYEPNCDGHIDGNDGYKNTPSVDGTDTLVPEDRIIRQTTTFWEESYPVQRDVVIRQAGVFENDFSLFELDETEIVKIDVYIWLEGKDVDCVNAVGRKANILANIQFMADADSVSGLVPIE